MYPGASAHAAVGTVGSCERRESVVVYRNITKKFAQYENN